MSLPCDSINYKSFFCKGQSKHKQTCHFTGHNECTLEEYVADTYNM